MPKTRREKRKRTEAGFAKEMENLENYLADLQEELIDTLELIQHMKPSTYEQRHQQIKQVFLVESLLRGLNKT